MEIKYGMRLWAGFNCLRIESGAGLLCKRW